MKELTDLEICKKIAEIEGFKVHVFNGVPHIEDGLMSSPMSSSGSYMSHKIYNPLADDALCFRLVVDGKMTLSWMDCPTGSGRSYFVSVGDKSTYYYDTPNKAVCMAKLEIFCE